ncbi:MAG: hypothetical protein WCJ62_05100 [Flavobacterium sp.]
MNKLIFIFLLLIITSCKKNETVETTKKNVENHTPKIKTPKKIGDYISDKTDFVWIPKHSETSGFLCEVVFKKEYLDYFYHGQCYYSYFTNYYHTKADKIELLWSYKSDCIGGVDFIEKQNGIKKYPKRGDSFCEYSLVNDTIIKVKYNFPEWAKEVNKISKDSIFPTYLYLKKK